MQEFLQLFYAFVEPDSRFKKFIKIAMYITLFGYVPVAGLLNIGDYYYNELGYKEFPFYLIIALSIIYFAIIAVLVLKYSNKLGYHLYFSYHSLRKKKLVSIIFYARSKFESQRNNRQLNENSEFFFV